jgi:bleomycin hydrolase
MKKYILIVFVVLLSSQAAFNQQPRIDKGMMIEHKNETWDSMKVHIDKFEKKEKPKKNRFMLDFSNIKIPNTLDGFKTVWHNDPVKQASTGTCWCFAATSFLESELKRVHNKEIKLSEMHTVWYQYVEKARRFIAERGDSEFGEGSQTNAVMAMWKEYGCVPNDVYNGMLPGQEYHNHSKMFTEMKSYLEFCKTNNIWNEQQVLDNIKSILNKYMSVPPTEFTWNGKKYTPKSFRDEVVKLNPDDYVDMMSLYEQGFGKKTIYDVPDNWWKSHDYYNIPVNDFMSGLKSAIRNGFSMTLSGDISEAGMYSYADAAVVPSFDIPSAYIDDYARQFRFSNGSTADDHAIHLCGWYENESGTWYLIKDSGSGAINGKFKGYYLFHEDFIKLKMTCFLVHKDAIKDILKNFDSQSRYE